MPLLQIPQKTYIRLTIHSDCIQIKTALNFNISLVRIYKYSYTEKQIRLVKQRLTPQKNYYERKP
jgi:hypothetical protein